VVHSIEFSQLGLVGAQDHRGRQAEGPVRGDVDESDRVFEVDAPPRDDVDASHATGRLVDLLARDLAAEIRSALQPSSWQSLLDRLQAELDPGDEGRRAAGPVPVAAIVTDPF
jgi:hypothetical protein